MHLAAAVSLTGGFPFPCAAAAAAAAAVAAVLLRPTEFLTETLNTELRLGETVERVDADKQTLKTNKGDVLHYDKVGVHLLLLLLLSSAAAAGVCYCC